MGLLKRMLSRGLSGAESAEPWTEPPNQNAWPPDPPPNVPPRTETADPQDPVFGLEQWRHPVMVGGGELAAQGFAQTGSQIQAAFASNRQVVQLTDDLPELGVNDIRFSTGPSLADLSLAHSVTGEIYHVDAAIWALTVALHDAYLEPLDPDRSWHIARVADSYLLFLARPEELAAIARRPEIDNVLELGKLIPN